MSNLSVSFMIHLEYRKKLKITDDDDKTIGS